MRGTVTQVGILAMAIAVVLAAIAPAAQARATPQFRDRTAPTAPGLVRATGTSTTQIRVTWRAARDNVGVRTYLVYRNGARLPVATVRGTVRALNDRVAPGTRVHRYVVRARDASGNLGRPSNTARASSIPPTTPSTGTGGTTGGGSTPAVVPKPPVSTPMGYATHVERQVDPAAYLDLAVRGGAGAIREDVSWADHEVERDVYDWRKTDVTVRLASQRGLQILMMVGTTPRWASSPTAARWAPPADTADYARFVGEVAARYGTGGTYWKQNPDVTRTPLIGIQVWNEPNIERFWKTGPDPVAYTALLRAAHRSIRAVDPNLPVISAGLAPHGAADDADCDMTLDSGTDAGGWNPLRFLERMYASGARGSFDALGWHPYNFGPGFSADAMLGYSTCSAWSQLTDTPLSVRSIMIANGDADVRVWATEIGAPACVPGSSYVCTTPSEIGAAAGRQAAQWRTYPWAGGFFWYLLRDDDGGDSTTDIEEHFGSVAADGTPKPAFAALLRAWGAG